MEARCYRADMDSIPGVFDGAEGGKSHSSTGSRLVSHRQSTGEEHHQFPGSSLSALHRCPKTATTSDTVKDISIKDRLI